MTSPQDHLKTGISSYFAEFGTTACEAIYQLVLRHRGVDGVLRKLDVYVPQSPDAQYQILLEYMRMNGFDAFIQGIRSATASKQAPAPPPGATAAAASASASSTAEREKEGTGPLRVRAKPPKSTAAPRQAGTGKAADPSSSSSGGRRSEAAAQPKESAKSAPNPDDEDTKPSVGLPMPRHHEGYDVVAAFMKENRAKKSKGVTADGKWDGVTERRSGRDRRAGTDRRSEVKTVVPGMNQRFGGERRSGIERRRNWPPKG